jgi:NAD(P)-dependent dehydrogenase (short-subunit alcohol dehydrogenase family)
MTLRGLTDRVVIVTGGAGGIGAAVASRMSAEGASVVVVDLDGEAAAATAATLPGPALSVAADVGDAADVDGYMTAAVERFGRVDAVHLNAGYAGPLAPLARTDLAQFDAMMRVNVRGAFLGLRAAISRMLEQGTGGAVLVTSSGLGATGAQGWGAYAASKHAAIGLVRCAALDHARDGIRVNALLPGFVDTAMVRIGERGVASDRAAARELLESVIPLGRYGEPEEMAGAAAWLLSEESAYVTGQLFKIDGGLDAGAFALARPSAAAPNALLGAGAGGSD